MTQAISVAERVASEMRQTIGIQIGYAVRYGTRRAQRDHPQGFAGMKFMI